MLSSTVVSYGVLGIVVVVIILFSCGYSLDLLISAISHGCYAISSSVIGNRVVALSCLIPLVVMVLHVLILPSCMGCYLECGYFGFHFY